MRRCGWKGVAGRHPGLFAAALAVAVVLTPRLAEAQFPVRAWVRPLVALPVGDFAGREEGIAARASTGFDAGGSLTLGALTVYGEYQEIAFECAECTDAGLEDRVLDWGWEAGVMIPIFGPILRTEPWVRLGVVGHHLRFRSGEERAYSNASLGWAAGLGTEARPLSWLRLEPAILFRSYQSDFSFSIDVPNRDVSTSYLAFGLGVGVELRSGGRREGRER